MRNKFYLFCDKSLILYVYIYIYIFFLRFGATYVGTKQISPAEAYPVLLGDIDPSGNLNANILHQFGSRLKGKFAAQVQRNKFTAVQMTADYRGDAYTGSLTIGNPDFLNGSGKLII
jgi:mitochondrial import receptor subunit TOM40